MFSSGCYFTIPNKFLNSKSHLKTSSPPLTNHPLKMISQRNAMHFFIAFALPILLLEVLPQNVLAMKRHGHKQEPSSSADDANKSHGSNGHIQESSSSGVAPKKRLHIAHVGGLNVEIPPKNVGGLEKVVEVLIFEQIRAGHKVTLFCTKDSGKFEEFAKEEGLTDEQAFEKKYGMSVKEFRDNFTLIHSGRDSLQYHTRNYVEYIDKIKNNPEDFQYVSGFQEEIIKKIREVEKDEENKFDIVHYHSMDHFEFNGAIFNEFNHMTLTTMHMSLEGERTVKMLSKYPKAKLVPISDNQKSHLLELSDYTPDWLPTVYNGYPTNMYKLVEVPEPKHPSWLKDGYPKKPGSIPSKPNTPYLAFLGRFSADKGAHNAIDIALRAGVELRLAANIPIPGKDGYEYYEKKLLSKLEHDKKNLIKFIGPVNEKQKKEFLGNALALLFPIEWQEPFGLVMIEAMAHGTPVIGANTGSVTEIVGKHPDAGRTFEVETQMEGEEKCKEKRAIYTKKTIEAAAELVKKIHELDRKKVRKVFEKYFSDKVMVGGYQKIYDNLIANKPAAESSASGSHPHSNSLPTHDGHKDKHQQNGSPKSPQSRKAHFGNQSDSPRSVHHHQHEEGGHTKK